MRDAIRARHRERGAAAYRASLSDKRKATRIGAVKIECVGGRSFLRQVKLDLNAEGGIGVIEGPAREQAVYAAAPPDGGLQAVVQRIGEEVECVQEVALPGAVRADQQRQRPELDVALCDAPEVLQPNAPNHRDGNRLR